MDKRNVLLMLGGAALMLVYLAVDGLTSTWQDGLFRQYNMSICEQVQGCWRSVGWTSEPACKKLLSQDQYYGIFSREQAQFFGRSLTQVLYTTMFSTLLSFGASAVTGQLGRSTSFLIRNPEAMWWILALSLSSAVVQAGALGGGVGIHEGVDAPCAALHSATHPRHHAPAAAHHQLHHQTVWSGRFRDHHDNEAVLLGAALVPHLFDAALFGAVVRLKRGLKTWHEHAYKKLPFVLCFF